MSSYDLPVGQISHEPVTPVQSAQSRSAPETHREQCEVARHPCWPWSCGEPGLSLHGFQIGSVEAAGMTFRAHTAISGGNAKQPFPPPPLSLQEDGRNRVFSGDASGGDKRRKLSGLKRVRPRSHAPPIGCTVAKTRVQLPRTRTDDRQESRAIQPDFPAASTISPTRPSGRGVRYLD